MIASDIPQVATYLLEKHALFQQGWRFAWDHARRRAGQCNYTRKVITLSRHFVELNLAERFDEIVDTILHEIAHAMTPGDGHGEKWKAACLAIGAKPERCYNGSRVAMPPGRYVGTCPGCNRQHRMHRKPKSRRYCRACGPERGMVVFWREEATSPPPTALPDLPPPPRRLRG